jgi:phospholipase/carboxylesterase
MQKLETIERVSHPGNSPTAVIIWLHGLGADYNDFVPLVPELNLDKCVKFIFPNAPMRPITINNGYVMRGWYDIRELSAKSLGESADTTGINQSVSLINQLIDEQLSLGFKSEQIIIAGFSQGGVMSYVSGLSSKHRLGGIVALSAYLPNADSFIDANSHNKNVAIFAAHGIEDPVVPYIAGTNASQKLIASGFNLNWHEYPMQHSLCAEEVQDLSNWFKQILADAPK